METAVATIVIHTVGPRWNEGNSNEPTLLANCYHNVLRLAKEAVSRKIAIPNISTGIYPFPKEFAAAIAIKTVNDYEGDLPEEVVFVCLDEENYSIYQRHII